MPRLIVTVSRLNKRKEIPLHFPDPNGIIGEVLMGFTFEGFEVGEAQIPNKSLGRWFKDRDGHFYWAGGLEEVPGPGTFEHVTVEVPPVIEEVPPSVDFSKMSWGHRFCEIPFIWNGLGTKGKGATVAVIDTGIDEFHEDLVTNIHPQSRSLAGEVISDTDGHGTTMAGIIGASAEVFSMYFFPSVMDTSMVQSYTLNNRTELLHFLTNRAGEEPGFVGIDIVLTNFWTRNFRNKM